MHTDTGLIERLRKRGSWSWSIVDVGMPAYGVTSTGHASELAYQTAQNHRGDAGPSASSSTQRCEPDDEEAHRETHPLLASAAMPGRSRSAAEGAATAYQQPAAMHKNFESLDYEDAENTVYRADQAARTAWASVAYVSLKWGICFLIGAVTAAAAFMVNLSVENISGFKFWATLTIMQNPGGAAYLQSFLLYATINAILVFSSVAITVFLGPAAAGSGISEVKAYLNGVDVPGIFYFNTLVAKVVGAVGAVAGGLAIGKEGPFVHAGAGIAAILSQGGPPHHQLPWFRRMWNDRDRNDLVACGAAAGIAAAFRSPVGGVLFVLEELTSWWKNQLLWLMFFTTAVVSVSVRVLMKACSQNGCGFFGSGGFIIFEIQEGQDNYEFYELLPMLLLGVVGGLLGSSFVTLNASLGLWRKRYLDKYGVKGRIAEALVVSLLTSIVSFTLPLMVPCQACPAEAGSSCPRRDNYHSGNFVSYACRSDHEYNDLATIFFNTQDDAIRNLFSSKTKQEYTVGTLLTFVTCFYFLAVITYGISCPTGLFVPSILCGAAYGRLVGIFVADIQQHQHIDEGTYALLGAASFLGGSMRLTMCTCVMLLELTNNMALLPLIMLVLLVAKAVGDGTGVKPIYEVLMQLKGMPFLPPQPEGLMRHVTVKECCGRPPITLQRIERVDYLVSVLQGCQHSSFPVIHTSAEDGSRFIMGVILRRHLLVLLSTKRALQPSAELSADSSRVATSYETSDFSKPLSTVGLTLADVQLSHNDLNMYLDLGPYANSSYYVVQEDAPLSKVYTLFRTLGLRYLCVIPRAHDVVGIVTRQDLLTDRVEAYFEQGLGQYTTDGITMVTANNGPASGSGAGGFKQWASDSTNGRRQGRRDSDGGLMNGKRASDGSLIESAGTRPA